MRMQLCKKVPVSDNIVGKLSIYIRGKFVKHIGSIASIEIYIWPRHKRIQNRLSLDTLNDMGHIGTPAHSFEYDEVKRDREQML